MNEMRWDEVRWSAREHEPGTGYAVVDRRSCRWRLLMCHYAVSGDEMLQRAWCCSVRPLLHLVNTHSSLLIDAVSVRSRDLNDSGCGALMELNGHEAADTIYTMRSDQMLQPHTDCEMCEITSDVFFSYCFMASKSIAVVRMLVCSSCCWHRRAVGVWLIDVGLSLTERSKYNPFHLLYECVTVGSRYVAPWLEATASSR